MSTLILACVTMAAITAGIDPASDDGVRLIRLTPKEAKSLTRRADANLDPDSFSVVREECAKRMREPIALAWVDDRVGGAK